MSFHLSLLQAAEGRCGCALGARRGGASLVGQFSGKLCPLWREVLREYESHVNWSTYKDYIYRGAQLLASAHPTEGVRHYHLDHLGTPRLITDAAGIQKAYHVYYPFGEEATAFNQDAEQMKFTGHERDLASVAGAGDDLDYMHARFYGPLIGRFSSTDSVQGKPHRPQSWGLYTYVFNNPLKYVDPDGNEAASVILCPGTLQCGGPLPLRQEVALWAGIVSAGAVAYGAVAVLADGAAGGVSLLTRFLRHTPAIQTTGAGLTAAQASRVQKINEIVHNWNARRTLEATGDVLVRHEKKIRDGMWGLQKAAKSINDSLRNPKLDEQTRAVLEKALQLANRYIQQAEEALRRLPVE